MDELVQWLGAQLDEDERIARAAEGDSVFDGTGIVVQRNRARSFPDRTAVLISPVATHIAAHDPARVLREIDAKRKIIAEVAPEPHEPETDAELHARFAHPAWEYATTEGPRKQWDDVDVPPRDEEGEPEPGWERNVGAGRDGWERFDYIEESYWRRRLPESAEQQPYIPVVLRLLALPYSDRPGYREAWRP